MSAMLRSLMMSSLALALASGCGDPPPAVGTGGNETEASGVPTFGTVGAETTEGSEPTAGTAVADGTASAADSSPEPTGGGPGSADSTADGGGTANDPGNPVDCGGTVYACGDGIDNDGDGFIDLLDPECTGPCDDDESSYQTGIPGDNMDCKQDCFFDGNSGQGDDGCLWNLKCDPENPGEFINCEYTGGNSCNNIPPHQSEECTAFCEPFVPPGCDCFGCCTVQTPEGPIDIFLNSHPDCSLTNLDACTTCTSQIDDCGNTCEPAECEICFGETEPPEGCGGNTCPSGDPCDADAADCPTDYFCYLGCCYPPPPG